MKKISILLLIVMVTTVLSSCSNTMDGAGRDVSNAGQWMQDTF